MTKLSVNEIDLLQRVDEKEDLRPLFFLKVKGVKWFDEFYERGYFNPESIPRPIPTKEEGYVNVPYWSVVDYLVKTSKELSGEENREYAEKFFSILVDVTNYAKEKEISNYRTWWQFAKIISQIPYKVIVYEHIDIVDYWLNDKYERGLIAQEIGEKWLPILLGENDDYALRLSTKLIEILYKVIANEQKTDEGVKPNFSLRFDDYHAHNITEKIANLAGMKLGKEAVLIFDNQLKYILDELKNDSWSAIWQPAIKDHEQNKYRDDAENILIKAYRDSLNGYIAAEPLEASEYVKSMLAGEYQTISRLAINAISTNYKICSNLMKIDILLDEKYLQGNFRHEMWHLLNRNYQRFSELQKQKILSIILSIKKVDDNGNIHEGSTAYYKAIWLSAIKRHGENESRLYKDNVEIAKTEPDHPDFSSYMSVWWGGRESPIPIEDLQALTIEELINILKDYKDQEGLRGEFLESGIEGLVKALKQVVRSAPLKFYDQLNKFIELDLAYVHEIIEAFKELWSEKAQLPWDDIWPSLLKFCLKVIKQDHFWDPKNAIQRDNFVANRYWIVSNIGGLIEAGTKSDDHAFSDEYLNDAVAIILFLLEKEHGNEFKIDSDAVSISINSPRGHCLEALINLTLRSCRLEDKKNNSNHLSTWEHFRPFYDAELDRADTQKPEYEFATLITNYLPNFLYMSREWVMEKLGKIFDQNHYLKWLCAMQGYAYVGTVYQEIYQYLKGHGDFIKVLDDENIKGRVKERVIQNIAVAYLNDFEKISDEDSLINILISKNVYDELIHLIWFNWSIEREGKEKTKNKVYELWLKMLDNMDPSTRDGRRLASQLCHWARFVDKVDNKNRNLLLAIAPYADEENNSYELLESIADISQIQPFEAHAIWMKMFEGTMPNYPEEAIQRILGNLIKEGPEGLRKAKEVVSEYLKRGNDLPATLLREIKS